MKSIYPNQLFFSKGLNNFLNCFIRVHLSWYGPLQIQNRRFNFELCHNKLTHTIPQYTGITNPLIILKLYLFNIYLIKYWFFSPKLVIYLIEILTHTFGYPLLMINITNIKAIDQYNKQKTPQSNKKWIKNESKCR